MPELNNFQEVPESPPVTPDERYGAIGQNKWYCKYDGDTAIVFVHGIQSNSAECWRSRRKINGRFAYWPHLLAHDERFRGISIFLGGYYADIDASFLGIPQAATQLFNGLRSRNDGKPVTEYDNIVFICHSMGGIIVRQVLVDRFDVFAKATVGLILIGSPSMGAAMANLLTLPIGFFRYRLARQLRRGSESLRDLETRFRELLNERKITNLRGLEGFEHHFYHHVKWLPGLPPLVGRSSAVRYFAEYPLPGTDHSSAVRPDDYDHPAYRMVG